MNTARNRQTSGRKGLFFNDLGASKLAKNGFFVTLSSVFSRLNLKKGDSMNGLILFVVLVTGLVILKNKLIRRNA